MRLDQPEKHPEGGDDKPRPKKVDVSKLAHGLDQGSHERFLALLRWTETVNASRRSKPRD